MKQKLRLFQNKILPLGVGVFLIDIFFQVHFRSVNYGVPNFGISFGVWEGLGRNLGILIFTIFSGWIVREMMLKRRVKTALVLVALGGLGNAISRIVIGNVWDYIYVPFLPFWFNLSDVLISFGVISYILWSNGDSSTI